MQIVRVIIGIAILLACCFEPSQCWINSCHGQSPIHSGTVAGHNDWQLPKWKKPSTSQRPTVEQLRQSIRSAAQTRAAVIRYRNQRPIEGLPQPPAFTSSSDDLLGDDLLGEQSGGDPLESIAVPRQALPQRALPQQNLSAETFDTDKPISATTVDPHEALWTEECYPSAESCR